MGSLIVESPITNNTVFGIRQMQYTVEGVAGMNFIDAVTTAAFKETVAIETAASSYVSVVEARQRKINELGDALAEITKAYSKLKVKGGKSDDETTIDNFSKVKEIIDKYGVSLSGFARTMTRSNIMKAQTNVQYEIDKEDNSLQQDMVAMKSYVTKRDNAYSTAAKIVKKANDAAQSTIRNMGE